MEDATFSCCQQEAQDLHSAWLLHNGATADGVKRDSPSDRNLYAIAQLAAFRLRARRAIVSLIDGGSQHVLAEATQTLSPCHDTSSSNDELILGVTSLPLEDAFLDKRILSETEPHSGQGKPGDRDHFVSGDCRLDDRFKDQDIVKKVEGVRFAAGVPLISGDNCMIGMLVVLDESPRDDVDDTELSSLTEYAQCVVRHLELVRSSSASPSREHTVLRGIAGCLADQYRSLPSEKEHGDNKDSKRSRRDTNEHEGPSIMEFEVDHVAGEDDSLRSLESSLKAAFDGVASVLQKCSQADGAIIFGPPSVANLMVVNDSTNPYDADVNEENCTLSSVLASCLREEITCPATKNQGCTPTVDGLRRLASAYPRGMVFNIADDSIHTMPQSNSHRNVSTLVQGSSHDQEEALGIISREVLNNLSEAGKLVFLPVYDHQDRKGLLASCFFWQAPSTPRAHSEHNVLDYHIIGNFLSHDIAQLRLQNQDAQQRKFMSNFSHELRTPINGILGAAQFLQDTVSDSYQSELLQSVVVSSNTLLDTLNVVLDYTKFEHAVSEVQRPHKEEASQSALPASVQPFYVEADVDLALLVEDATETVVAGHFFDNLPPDTGNEGVVDRTYENYRHRQGMDRGTTQDVKVILQLSARPSWSVKTSPGAISRVVMNLVGNALKFTHTGNIVVKLIPKADEDTAKINVRLRIEDSGIGMTEHFIKHHLFAPYRQGNSFSPGVGLGMSVLKHMVSSLNGNLSITSKVNEGTSINVDLTLAASEHADDGIPKDLTNILERIKGKHLVLLDINSMYDEYKPKDSVIQRVMALRSVATNWLGMRVSTSTDIDVEDADFYLFSEPPPVGDILERHQKAAKSKSANMEVPLLVVATDSREAHMINRNHAVSLEKTGRIVQVLSQPCGPRKLAKVLNLCQDRVEQSKKDRASKDHGSDHKPSEAEPETDHDQYGNAEDGQNIEDMDGPPSVSGTKAPPKKVSRLTSNATSEGQQDDDRKPESEGDEDQTSAENTPENQEDDGKGHEGEQEDEEKTSAEKSVENEGHQNPESMVPRPPFTKPLVLSRSPADATPSTPKMPKERNLHGLCVDDNKINLRLLVTLMRREKHTYEQSENGQEALEVFKASNGPDRSSSDDSRKPFDFILMDIGMPVMNGIQCTRAIREYERQHRLTPTYIVACTAWGDGPTQREAKEAGMDAFLPKPLKFAQVKELLAGLMEHE